MKDKTIRRILHKQLTSWIDSIEDKKLRTLVYQDCILTGGAIVSYLQQQDPNDFDIYFKTRSTAEAIAQYYIEKFLYKNDDWDEEEIFLLPEKEYPNQVKIFVRSEGIATKPKSGKFSPIFLTSNAITLSNKIQLIFRFYGPIKEIHKNYDFIHCTCSYDYQLNKLNLPSPALVSILTKELKYVGSLYPVCSMFRLRKFIQRQWTINAGEMLKIALQINQLDLFNPEVLEDQLIGVDTTYFRILISEIKKLKEKEELSINYIAGIIDKIFNE